MSTDKDFEFDDLSRLWREDPGPPVSKLKKQVRRRMLFNRLTLVGETVVVIAGGTVGIWLMMTGQWLIGAAASVFSAFGLIMSISTRWRSPRLDTETLQVAVQSALTQTQIQYRGLVGGVWICAAALVFLAIIGWDATTRASNSAPELLWSISAVAAATLVVGISLAFIAARLRSVHRRAVRLSELWDNIGSD